MNRLYHTSHRSSPVNGGNFSVRMVVGFGRQSLSVAILADEQSSDSLFISSSEDEDDDELLYGDTPFA